MQEFLISEKAIFFTLLLTLYGTNLFYYASIGPSMPHIYSFGLQAVFLYYLRKSIYSPIIRNLLIASVLLSLLLIIRPTNILSIAAIPLLAGDAKTLKIFLSDILTFKKIAVFLASTFAILSIQFIKWHAETGKCYIWGYSGEGFVFFKNLFFSIFFSVTAKAGLLTPLSCS